MNFQELGELGQTWSNSVELEFRTRTNGRPDKVVACWQLCAMPQIVSLHWPAVAVTILSGISAGTNSAAIHYAGLFVGVVDGDKGSEMGSGPS